MRHVLSILFAISLVVCANANAFAAPTKRAAKTHAPMKQSSTIKSPNGECSLVLTKPLQTDLGTIWRKVDLKDNGGKITNIEDESDQNGSAYEPAEDNLWSPDGKFATIYHNTLSGSEWRQDDRLFVDCENGITTTFQTKNGTSANLSNCQAQWIKGKPHSLLVIDDTTNKDMEAQPPKL